MRNHISIIMSKRHGIFTENLLSFFSSAGKTGNVPNLTNFRRPSFGDDLNVKFIL